MRLSASKFGIGMGMVPVLILVVRPLDVTDSSFSTNIGDGFGIDLSWINPIN